MKETNQKVLTYRYIIVKIQAGENFRNYQTMQMITVILHSLVSIHRHRYLCCRELVRLQNELILNSHLYNYFHPNNLFYQYQTEFLPGHSTVHQLLDTYHSIAQNIDEGKFSCMIFCDLSIAFERVWRSGLLFKLQNYGLSGDLLTCFSSITESDL